MNTFHIGKDKKPKQRQVLVLPEDYFKKVDKKELRVASASFQQQHLLKWMQHARFRAVMNHTSIQQHLKVKKQKQKQNMG